MARFDNIGLFWQDVPEAKTRKDRVYIQPEIPDTGWTAPREFPNLSGAKAVSYDVETYDPELTTKGPGWGRGIGHIVGISLGVPEGGRWYFPMRHTVEPEQNMDPQQVLRFINHTLKDNRPKIGANLYYDLGWLLWEGVSVNGPQYDVQYAEALLDSETPKVALEHLAQRYLKEGKSSPVLYQWLCDFYGGNVDDKQRANIYRAPPRLVGPYAESDADLPLRIVAKQWKALHDKRLLDVYATECALIPLLVRMRLAGAPVDLDYTQQLHDELADDIKTADAELQRLCGTEVNVAASASLAKAFDSLGLDYPRTDKGNPSFTKEFLEHHGHPFAQLITERRQMEKIRGTFLQSYILESHVDGRVHGEFHPLKGDGYGARSGRFASRNPNLQNIPTRSKLGKRVRRAFKDKDGRPWRKYDYSQIEYRLLAHHAVGNGAEKVRERYRNDPSTDYHKATQALVLELTGQEIERPKIKNINFGFIYGMSQPKLARYLGLTDAAAKQLFDAYHTAVPYARQTMQYYMDVVGRQGYVSTFAGRRSVFPKWTSARYVADAAVFDTPGEAAAKYGRVKRAFAHKALNRVLQGGAADIMKRAMVQCYERGIFDATGLPLLTVHDELDFVDDDVDAAVWAEMADVMMTCAPEVTIPIIVDAEIGPSWGEVEELAL